MFRVWSSSKISARETSLHQLYAKPRNLFLASFPVAFHQPCVSHFGSSQTQVCSVSHGQDTQNSYWSPFSSFKKILVTAKTNKTDIETLEKNKPNQIYESVLAFLSLSQKLYYEVVEKSKYIIKTEFIDFTIVSEQNVSSLCLTCCDIIMSSRFYYGIFQWAWYSRTKI